MNLLEHYIKDVKDIKIDEKEQFPVSAIIVTDCYGCIDERTRYFSNMEELNELIKKGYYMG